MKESSYKNVGGKYTVCLKQVLGKGAFATTYLAKTKTDPPVLLACKMMIKKDMQESIKDVGYVIKRVQEEAKNWKTLDHPNIVKFSGCQETKNNIYFFMQHCNEGTLHQYIQKNKIKINYPEVVGFSKQLVSGCAYLEEKGILHRDIKPANIFIKNKQVKLGDFGLAKLISQLQKQSFFTFAGTLHFMAPQIFSSEKSPYKCDVWSVGVSIFLLFTNELPFGLHFKDHSDKKILQKITEGECKFNYPVFEEYTKIKEILQKMLLRDPKERPTMKEVEKMFELL